MSDVIGSVALNCAFILYLIHYFPQLIHNTRKEKLQRVSLHFHGLLGLSYLTDLSYGFGLQLPWQYRLVSIIGVVCISIQHWQLMKVHAKTSLFQGYSVLLGSLFLLFFITLLFTVDNAWFLGMGYISQGTALVFMLPVIVNNWKKQNAQSLSLGYLGLNTLCYTSTFTAAVCLHWPLPSKLGTLFGLACLFILMSQTFWYKHSNHSITSCNNSALPD